MNGRSKKAAYRAADSAQLSAGYAKLSKKAASSAKGLVVFAAIFIIAADLFALALMLYQKLGYPYLLFPSILIAADALFLLFAFFTNFRFRYSEALLWCYILVVAVLSALFLWQGSARDKTYFTYIGICIFLVPHLLMWVALWWTTRLAKTPSFRKRKAATVAAIALVAVAATGFGVLRAEYGTFGQNDVAERAVAYRFNDAGDAYIATEILAGRGTSVTIKETFNGKTVEGIDCALFSSAEVETVKIESRQQIALYGLDSLKAKNPDIDVIVCRGLLDSVREQVFREAKTKRNNLIGDFLKQIVPEVAEDETFVTFTYDFETLPLSAEPIPSYIGKKNEVFQASNLGSTYRNLYEKSDDLEWNYLWNFAERLKTLASEQGRLPVGERLTKSIPNVEVAFERVYKVERSYGEYRYGGEWVYSTYATPTEAEGCLAFTRTGCVATWDVSANGVAPAVVSTEEEFAQFLSSAGNAKTVKLTANWEVLAPGLKLTTDAVGNAFTYGDDVAVTAEADTHDLKTTYKLLSEGGNVVEDWKTTPRFSMSRIVPNLSGTFTVAARSVDDYDDRLYSESFKTISLKVKKKVLDFDWTIPDDLVYDGTAKTVSAKNRAGQTIGGDLVEYRLSETTVQDAKTYRINVLLSSESAEKYAVSEITGTSTITVNPKPVTVDWRVKESYVYDGTTQVPKASATGVSADGAISLTVTGAGKNAGDYVAKAFTDNQNYTLRDAEKPFTVQKRAVSATWSGNSFVYNGRKQNPTVENLDNVVTGELSEILGSVALTDANAVNVGVGYAVTATLPETSNYRFASAETAVFEITKKSLSVKADDGKKVYDGKRYADFSKTSEGLAETDRLEEVLKIDFSGAAITAVGVGDYLISVTYSEAEKFGNYSVSVTSGTLTVTKRPITVAAEPKTKTYDNRLFTEFSVTVSNLAEGDALSDVGAVRYAGEATEAVNASEKAYSYSPKIELADCGVLYQNYEVSYRDGTLTILKKEVGVIAVGGTKTYDGAPFTDFGYQMGALADGDSLADVVSFGFGGAAVGEVNAGTFALTANVASEGVKFKNYSFAFEAGSVVISPKALSITAKNAKKVYDNKRYAFGEKDYDVTGLTAADKLSEILSVAFTGDAVTGIVAGNYVYEAALGETFGKYRNYNVTFGSAELTIEKRGAVVTAANVSKTYDGKIVTGFNVSVSNLADGDTVKDLGAISFTGDAVTAINASERPYALLPQIAQGDEGAKYQTCYLVTFQGAELTIQKRDAVVTAEDGGKIYDGTAYDGFSAKAENLADGETLSGLGTTVFGGEALSSAAAGLHAVTVTIESPTPGYDNYNVRFVSGTVTISPRQILLKAVGTPPDVTKIYDGTTDCGFEFRSGTHFVLDGADAAKGEITGVEILSKVYNDANVEGASRVTVTFGKLLTGVGYNASNYVYSSGGTLDYAASIAEKEVAVVWTDTTKTYTGSKEKPTAQANGIGGAALKISVTVDGKPDGAADAGRYSAAAICENRNYKLIGAEQSFVIESAVAEVIWDTQTEFIYTGAEQSPSASAKGIGGESVALTVGVTKDGTECAAVNVGTYTAAAKTSNANYRLTNTEKTFTIVPTEVSVTWSGSEFTYTGAEQSPAANAKGIGGESVALTVGVTKDGTDCAAVNVGTYTAAAKTNNANYRLTNTEKTFTIVPKEVSVTWSGSEFIYTGAEQSPAANAKGIGGESAALTVGVTKDGTESTAVNVGTYTAAAKTNNANYRLTNTEFSFTIVPKEVSVTWSGLEFIYTGAEQSPSASAKGIDGESVALTVGVTKDGTECAAVNVGTYTAAAKTSNTNYRLTHAEKIFTIVPKEISVKWGILRVEYNGAAQMPVATAETIGGGQRQLDVSFSGGASKKDAGTYEVSAAFSDGNYRLTNEKAEFVIAPKSIAVNWTGGAEYVYDGTAHAPTAAVEGVGGEVVEIETRLTGLDGKTVSEAIETGSYTATVTTSNRNYVLTDASFDFRITEPAARNVWENFASDATEAHDL